MKSEIEKGETSIYIAIMAMGFGILMGFLDSYPAILPSISVSVEIDSMNISSTIPTYILLINPIFVLVLFYLAGKSLDLTKTRLGLLIFENFFGVIVGFTIGQILYLPGTLLHLIPLIIFFSLLSILGRSLNLFFIEFTALTIAFMKISYRAENSQASGDEFSKLLFIISLLSCVLLGFFSSYTFIFWFMELELVVLSFLYFAFAMIFFLLNPILIFMIFHKIGNKFNNRMKLTPLILTLIIGNFTGFFIGYIIPPLVASLETTSMLILFIPKYYYPIRLIFVQLTALYLPFVRRMKRIRPMEIDSSL